MLAVSFVIGVVNLKLRHFFPNTLLLYPGYVTWKHTTCNKPAADLFGANVARTNVINKICSHCLIVTTPFWQRARRLLESSRLLQVAPETCCCPAVQQLVNKLWVNDIIVTTCWQGCCKHVRWTTCDNFMLVTYRCIHCSSFWCMLNHVV